MRAVDREAIVGPDRSAARASSPNPPGVTILPPEGPHPAVPLSLIKYALYVFVVAWFVYTAAGQ